MSNSTVCVDASVVVPLVYDSPTSESAELRWREWKESHCRIVASALLPHEVANALHRYWTHGMLSDEGADESMRALLGLEIELVGETVTYIRAAELARELRLPAVYDAHYLAVAELLAADFWTADRKLVRSLGPKMPWVYAL